MADAETRANRMLQATERKARARAEEVLTKARTELADLRQSQEQANQWLVAARTYIGQAIGTYESSSKPELLEPPDVVEEANAEADTTGGAKSERSSRSVS